MSERDDTVDNPRATTPVLDLNVVHRVYHDPKGLTIWLTWHRHDGRPVIALTPASPVRVLRPENTAPCVVHIDGAYLWDHHLGDAEFAVRTSTVFADALGFNPADFRQVGYILGLIRDLLPELLMMPPMPDDDIQTVADAVFTDADGRQQHREIKAHV